MLTDEELLIPVPCFSSDSEDDEVVVAERVRVREAQQAAADQAQYAHDYAGLHTSGPAHHTHARRALHEQPELYERLRSEDSLLEGCGIDYVNVRDPEWTAKRFTDEYAARARPAMLTGATEEWRAKERWGSVEDFVQWYGDVPFKVTEVFAVHGLGKPKQIRLPLKMYVEYAHINTADFPFYVFERELTGQRAPLLDDFTVPHFFTDDVFDITPAARHFFPKYRYMVIGGQRTGSNMHIDPKCTCAWNALLAGHKRWVLFPPGHDPAYLREIGVVCEDSMSTPEPPTHWWTDVYPGLAGSGRARELGMVECIQRPGDTIYVPQGWWHAVLNLDFTVAVTQNALMPCMLSDAWPRLHDRWPHFAAYLARALHRIRPDVCEAHPDVLRLARDTHADAARDDDYYDDFNEA